MVATSRKPIKNAITARLIAADTLAGIRVYPTRYMAVDESELPCLLVQTPNETCEWLSVVTNARTYLTRTLSLDIVAIVQSLNLSDDLLDDLCKQVESALESFVIPGVEAADIRLQQTELEGQTTATQPIAIARLNYQIVYNLPYRDVQDPYVDWESADFLQSGFYPGGRAIEKTEPPAFIGNEYPLPDSTISSIPNPNPTPPP